ncbi:hypothetical protein IAT38_002146 [Cryptococcus sp. DSM 104549]
MACRHALSPAASAMTRLFHPSPLQSFTRPSYHPFTPRCSATRRAWGPVRLASTSAKSSEEPEKEEKVNENAWVAKEREGGPLPVPDNVLSASLASGVEGGPQARESGESIPLYPPPSSGNSHLEEPPSLSSKGSSTSSIPPPTSSTSTPLSSSDPTSPRRPNPDLASGAYSLPSLPNNITIPPELRARLTEWSNNVMAHSKQVAQEAQKQFVTLGLKVNEMTGYQEVERLKALVFHKEDELQKLRESARAAKTAYDEAVAARSEAQRDVNSLLERKHSWTDSDVSRFTTLVRSDHTSSHAVASTSVELKEAELAVDKAFSELMQVILQRYHEEQVWSDKIRSVSTWANVLGLLVNLVVFMGAVVVVEPWKRRRLVEKLEERVAGMMEKVDKKLGGVEAHLERVVAVGAGHTLARESASAAKEEILEDAAIEEAAVELVSTEPEVADLPAAPAQSDPIFAVPELPVLPVFHPLVTATWVGLPEYLDPVTKPSQERDLALAGVAGAVIAWTLLGVGRLVFS